MFDFLVTFYSFCVYNLVPGAWHLVLKKGNKIVKIKKRIKILFFENHKRYGYRRIHLLLKREGIIISEKIVRSIMKEENLIVRIIRQKKI